MNDPILGTMTDSRDGRTYGTVTIENQIWMTENLNYEIDSSSCYNNSADYCDKYGRLYKWAEMMLQPSECNAKFCGGLSTMRGICPDGWRVPSISDFNRLIDAVGGKSVAGKVLRSVSGWNDGGGSDSYYFSALPAGYREEVHYYDNKGYKVHYYGDGDVAWFWSYDQCKVVNGDVVQHEDEAYAVSFAANDDFAVTTLSKIFRLSVRCVKDLE